MPRDLLRTICGTGNACPRSWRPSSASASRRGGAGSSLEERLGGGTSNRTAAAQSKPSDADLWSPPPLAQPPLRILEDMSDTRDKRRRIDLDLFVLALVADGISTPYELKTVAGLSPGATIPTLARLLEAHLVLQSEPGPRGRADYKITAAGRRYLKSGWKGLVDDGPSGDLDADLRVALLAVWVGGDRRLGADFLRQSAEKRLKAIRTVEEPDDSTPLPPLALWYRRLRSTSADALLKGESATALAMAKALPRRPSGKQKQGRAASKP
jgi:DNA-binding PadR family transcriptional regulator